MRYYGGEKSLVMAEMIPYFYGEMLNSKYYSNPKKDITLWQ
jgi:hypothetical protein